jgi:hypothetical protein
MTLYRKRSNQPLRWLLAVLVFALAMGFTLDEVEGFNIPKQDNDSLSQDVNAAPPQGNTNTRSSIQEAPVDPPYQEEPQNVSSIPEPGTLLLLAGGLSAMYLMRRKKA